MGGEHGDAVYSIGLLRNVAGWSVLVALAAALLGSAIAHDLRFGVSCLIGAAFDVGTLYWALHRTKDVDPREALTNGPLASFFILRILVKAALLVVAVLLPQWLNLFGMAAGVIIVDFTLMTVGSAAAAWHMFRPHSASG